MSTVKQGEKVCLISVIIPILQGDDSWQALLSDLVAFPESSEFLFVSNGMAPPDLRDRLTEYGLNSRSHWYCTTRGRAIQMNHGELHAQSEYLLFLHADSRLSHSGVTSEYVTLF